ncbi:MAG: phosphoribosylglycinamide formyltransferase [Geminicoccaceae bacterium]|nr:phosphoribosylglycinamide formyltransferase [Geminicoccaceae bacterium]
MGRRATAVLISGSGTNLQALLDAARAPDYPAAIRLVVSNRPDAFGLERARRAKVPAVVVDHRAFAAREDFEAAIEEELRLADVELVCLAGFMRILSAEFCARWRDRVLNIHPSLLPAYRGLRTHERALSDGVAVSGCTVHFVRPELDAGPVLVQGVVPVLPDDDAERLRRRVLEVEHRCYPLALALLASGRVRVEGERVLVENEWPGERLVVHPLLARLAANSPSFGTEPG